MPCERPGLRFIEVGLADRLAGAGCRDAEPWEIDAAISERTALVHYVAGPTARPPLEAVVHVAHARGVPVLVDAAAQLPPKANLRHFIVAGADLVAFSGGKAIGGPQVGHPLRTQQFGGSGGAPDARYGLSRRCVRAARPFH